MTAEPSRGESFEDIISRLVAGEPPERVLISLRPPIEVHSLKRCAAVGAFDRKIYERVLAVDGRDDVLSFDELTDLPEVERVPRTFNRYRLTDEARATFWSAWWFDQSEGQEPVLPSALEDLVRRLAAFYRSTSRPVDELAQLVFIDTEAARQLFKDQFAKADIEFDLPLCQDLLNALGDTDRASMVDPVLLELHEEHAAYLQARSHFLVDFFKAAPFYETDGTLDTYRALLAGEQCRVLELHAPGGSGKTMELRWLISRVLIPEHSPLGRGRIPGTRVDFDFLEPVNVTRTPWLVLLEIAAQLNHQIPGYPFKEFLETYGWAVPLLLRKVTEPTHVAAASRRLRNQRARLSRSVPNRFLATLNSVIGEGIPVVMAFDTLEEVHLRPDGDLDGLLRLLKQVHDGAPCVRLVLAGRYQVSKRALVTGLPPFTSRELSMFTPRDSGRYLTQRGVTDQSVRDAVIAKAEGAPFKLSLLADLVLRVINRVNNPEVCWLLRYGVVARNLDLAFVRMMEPQLRSGMSGDTELDDPSTDLLPNELPNNRIAFPTNALRDPTRPLDVDRIWRELSAYAGTSSWVNTSPDDPNILCIHPDVVRPMRRLIRLHPVHGVLQRAAAAHYASQAASNPQHREIWLREAIYHRFQLEGHAAETYWRGLLDEVGLHEPEVREALAAEVLGPEYVDERGHPRLWHGDVPMITEAAAAEAMLVRANALAQIVRVNGIGPEDRRWNKVDQLVAGIERLSQGRSPETIASWRLAYARAALALKARGSDRARQLLIEALEHLDTLDGPLDTEATYDHLRLRILLGDVQMSMRDPSAFDSYRAALAKLPSQAHGRRRLETIIRTRLVRAHQVLDLYDEAAAQLRTARRPKGLDRDQVATLDVLAIRNARSMGRLESARTELERLGTDAATQDLVREAVLVALAQHNPVEALRILDPPWPRRVEPPKTTTSKAWEQELAGMALASLADYDNAMDAFVAARNTWHADGNVDAELRCHTHAALLQIREVGNFSLAEQHLAEGADLWPQAARREWLRLSMARAELLVRQDRASDGMQVVLATIEVLQQHNCGPAALVRSAVEGLATGQQEHLHDLLDVLVRNLGLITPASARVVALRYLERVPAIQLASVRGRFRSVHDLLRGHRDNLGTTDLALQDLTLGEVYRLWGRTSESRSALISAAQNGARWASPHFVRRWALALDRVDEPIPADSPQVRNFLETHHEFPALRGAFAVERAEAALKRGDRSSAERSMDQALGDLQRLDGQENQWHARLELVKGEVGRIAQAEMAKAQALAIVSRLNSTIRVSPLSNRFPDVEQDTLAMHIVRAGAVINEVLRQPFGSRAPEWQAIADVLTRLVEEIPSEDGSQDASEDVANRLEQNWRTIARVLGQFIHPEARQPFVQYEPRENRIEVQPRRWSMMPWELAYRPGTDMLLSLEPDAGPLYRALSTNAVRRGEVSFVQLALNRLMNAALPLDGVFGPITRQALARYQEDHGLEPSGRLTDELRTRLQQALTTGHKPPLVVVVQQSPGRQLRSHRGHANTGVDLSRLYRRHGFEVVVVENPTLKGLSNALGSLIAGGRVPALLHLSGGLRESNGNLTFSFLAGSGEEEAYSGGMEEIVVSSMDGLLAPFPGNEVAPIVILDVDRPRGTAETALHLLQRNAFAGELFALGRCAAVLGTGLVGREGSQLYEQLVRSLANGRSLSEMTTTVRSLASTSEPRGELKLERVLSFLAIALFTNLPWLRLTRREPEA